MALLLNDMMHYCIYPPPLYSTKMTTNDVTRSPLDDRDWVIEAIANYDEDTLPKTHMCRPDLLGIKDQGTLPTCAAHVAATMKEYQEKCDIESTEKLSPMYVYNQRSNQGEPGMYGRDLMKILMKHGICRESSMPYPTVCGPDAISETCRAEASHFRIKGYAQINTIDGLKAALVLFGPCFIAFPTYDKGKRMWKPKKRSRKNLGGHAMTVIGYHETKGFLIQNSWGKKWAKNGCCWYPYRDFGAHWEIWTTVDADSSSFISDSDRDGEQSDDDEPLNN